jgi:hypothetical protein
MTARCMNAWACTLASWLVFGCGGHEHRTMGSVGDETPNNGETSREEDRRVDRETRESAGALEAADACELGGMLLDASQEMETPTEVGEAKGNEDPTSCIPSCGGKECGRDGCSGSCGTCSAGMFCNWDGICISPGFCGPAAGVAGCSGCPCEACVCAANPYCCEIEWTPMCVADCFYRCGGCLLDMCGDGLCSWPENCSNCTEDCQCTVGPKCHYGTCCTSPCAGLECGTDVCGNDCGGCPDGAYCVQGKCVAEQMESCCGNAECGIDPCRPWELCGTCSPVQGVCIVDLCVPVQCDWGDWWVHCQNTGDGKSVAFMCKAGGLVEDYCYCQPGYGFCHPIHPIVFSLCAAGCLPNCAGKECGDDGCGCPCGLCPAGMLCVGGICE